MFIILPAYFNTLCNITMWGKFVSESGASCFRVSLMWGELSWGELSCVQTFNLKSVSPEVLDQEQLLVLFRSYFSFSLNIILKLFLNHFVEQFYNFSPMLSFVFMLRDQ